MKRFAYVGASLLLAMSVATACSDDKDDKSGKETVKVASTDDFCGLMNGFGEVSDEESFVEFRDELKDLGLSEEVEGDARAGFEVLVDLDWEETQDEDSVPKEDQEKVVAFFTRAYDLCGLGVDPSAVPNE